MDTPINLNGGSDLTHQMTSEKTSEGKVMMAHAQINMVKIGHCASVVGDVVMCPWNQVNLHRVAEAISTFLPINSI